MSKKDIQVIDDQPGNGYSISCDKNKLDVAIIHSFLANSYWAGGIPLETLIKAIENSLCFGVFTGSGEQVGFARVITDCATYAYLADVFIIEAHRGKGLSKLLMQFITAHPSLQGLRRITLATRDAHNLYARFGFESLANPMLFMEKWNPDVYQR